MNKKRLLLGCLISTMSLVLSACDFLPQNLLPNRKNSSSQESSQRSRVSRNPSSSSGEHVHTFSEEWSYNSYSHWHAATCGHSLKSDIANHEFYSSILKQPTCTIEGQEVKICTVCDYRETIAIPTTDHTWFEYSRVEPTCSTDGLSKKYCTSCGATREDYLPPINHEYETIAYQQPTCAEPGFERLVCKFCGEVVENVIPTTNHMMSVYPNYVYGHDGTMNYEVNTCMKCGTKRIAIKAVEGVLNGEFKTGIGLDFGYIKLKSNGQSISYSFDYPSTAYGKLYMHACMDTRSYQGITYRYNARDGYPYNFQISLNGGLVDMSQSADIPFEQFFDNGEYIEELSNNGYTSVNNCIVGDIALNQGINEFTYTRLSSYNLSVDYFIFDVVESDHVHTVSSEWSCDDNSHWHSCTDSNCPISGARIDGAAHAFGETYVVTEATCQHEGLTRKQCTICGYNYDTVIPVTDHNYQDVGAFEVANGSTLMEEYRCVDCGENTLRWNAKDYDRDLSCLVEDSSDYIRFQNTAENANGVEQTGSHIIYRINSPVAMSNVGLSFYINVSSGRTVFDAIEGDANRGYIWNNYGELEPSPKRYGLRINGNEIALGDDIYGQITKSTTAWFNWPVKFNLVEGENRIDIYCLGGYRVRMYQFQITGVPYLEPNHVHTPGNELHYDSEYHFYECASGDGVRFEQEYHQYGPETVITAPTCESDGTGMVTCQICGYDYYYTISALGHNWGEGEIVTQPTHTEQGLKVFTCSNCGAQTSSYIKPDHNWGEATIIDGDESHVSYTKKQCQDDNFVQIDIESLSGSFPSSYKIQGNKYIRLASTGNVASYSFTYSDHAIGQLYLRASASSYSSNKSVTYSSGGSGSTGCNFEVAVNNLPVNMDATKNTTYEEMLDDGWVDPNLPNTYSPVNDCLVGNIELRAGENVITYTMTGSYNLYFSDLILVVEHTEHGHQVSDQPWSYDDQYHWHTCQDTNCPLGQNAIVEREPHDFMLSETITPSSCNDTQTAVYVCRTCGYQVTTSEFVEHTYDESSTIYGTNSEGVDFTIKQCSVCQKTVEATSFYNGGNLVSGDYNAGKLTVGTTLRWRLPVYQTGQVTFYLPVKISNASHETHEFDPSLYQLTASNTNLNILVPGNTYGELGFTTSTKYIKFATYQVTEYDVMNGEIEITFSSNNSSYRLIFDGEIRMEY